jgi:hypothetical protein
MKKFILALLEKHLSDLDNCSLSEDIYAQGKLEGIKDCITIVKNIKVKE